MQENQQNEKTTDFQQDDGGSLDAARVGETPTLVAHKETVTQQSRKKRNLQFPENGEEKQN